MGMTKNKFSQMMFAEIEWVNWSFYENNVKQPLALQKYQGFEDCLKMAE